MGGKVRTFEVEELKELLSKSNFKYSEIHGKSIKERLELLLGFLNNRFGVKFLLVGTTDCGASSSFRGSPAGNPPTLPKTITFNFRGKYSHTVKHAVYVFCHEYGHLLLNELGWKDYEEYCNQFADMILLELGTLAPDFLYGDIDA